MFFSKVGVLVHDMELANLSDLVCHRDGYGIHKAIWRLFEDPSIKQRDFLYRYENEDGKPVFYVVSQREPIPQRFAWDVRTKPYAPRVSQGQRLSFMLRANPVRAGKSEDGQRYARHDVVMAAKRRVKTENTPPDRWPLPAELIQTECVNWLQSRAESCGFTISPHEVRADAYRQHRYFRRANGKIQFSTVDFAGLLTVVDPERFVGTLFHGIGHCKAFGCGMLLVRRTG